MENFNQTVFDPLTFFWVGEMFGCFFGGRGAMGETKVVSILRQMFESIKKPYKEPSPTVHKINIIDFDNFAHGLP